MTTFHQQTRAIVRLDSHISGAVDLSPDVVRVHTSKYIKSAGKFQIQLTPRKNYLNVIYPDDVINIYFDPGDGKRGFVRTMFGYVDRVDRTETTNPDTGAITTVYTIIGSDFQKALDKTNIYFNPHLETFIDVRFKNSLLGQGSTLRVNGVVASGTPASFVENILQTLGGFGQQWELPSSYPPTYTAENRKIRRQRIKNRIPTQVADGLAKAGLGLEHVARNIDQYLAEAKRVVANNPKDKLDDNDIVAIFAANEALASTFVNSSLSFRTYRAALQNTDANTPAGLIDLMDFGFIEHLAIDGFNFNQAVWQSHGVISQILKGRSNGIVNELMFDLRPVSNSEDSIDSGPYSREADELGINKGGMGGSDGDFSSNVEAVKYVPAVVMREYPYSTVEGFDLTNYYVLGVAVGFIPFGPIFSQPVESNERVQRLIYNYERVFADKAAAKLTPEKCLFEEFSKPLKHLDVFRLDNADVTNSSIGRSDEDTLNLFAVYANGLNARNWKFMLQDFSPIVDPTSIARHGLRVHEPTTDFANYSRDPTCTEPGNSAVDSEAVRRNLIRWQLMMDHWYQHNIEYLNGQIETRFFPELRAGYRLDWSDRNESYYVDGVAHMWEYPGAAKTTIYVSRGQRNDPMLAYIPPALPDRTTIQQPQEDTGSLGIPVSTLSGAVAGAIPDAPSNIEFVTVTTDGGNRNPDGRLAQAFKVRATDATIRSRGGHPQDADDNILDIPPTADRGGRAEYPNVDPSNTRPGSFGATPNTRDRDDISIKIGEEANKAGNKKRKGKTRPK